MDFLTVTEAAEQAGVCTKTIYRHVRAGRLQAKRIGRVILIHPTALTALTTTPRKDT